MALLRRTSVLAAIGTTVVATAVVAAGPSQASTLVPGTFNTVAPTRVLDTRLGTGHRGAIPAYGAITFRPTYGAAAAYLMTVTAISPAGTGHLTMYATGTARPATSSLSFVAGSTQRNAVVASPGTGGDVTVYNSSPTSVNVFAALTGYWVVGKPTTAGAYIPVKPTRLASSTAPSTAIAGLSSRSIRVAGSAGIPSNATAVVANLTAYSGRDGYLSAAADGDSATATWSTSFTAAGPRANLVIVPINPDGTISLYNGSPTATGFQLDVDGYIANGTDSTAGTPSADGAYLPSTGYRVADTRGGDAIPASATRRITILGAGQNTEFKSVVITLTTESTAAGYLEAWNGTSPAPTADLLDTVKGQTTSTTVRVPINDDGTISIANRSTGPADVVVDVQGFVLYDLSGTNAQIRRTTDRLLQQAQARAIH